MSTLIPTPTTADSAAGPPLPAPPVAMSPVPPAAVDWFRLPAAEPPAEALRSAGYRLQREIGRGAMGVVFEAEQLGLKRMVAVKLLHPASPLGPQAAARFRAEAEAAARLSHPNIVTVYGLEEAGGRALLVMEYVAGESLADRLGRSPLAPGEAAKLVAAVADAVVHSHRRGVVHRDLKPANVLIGPDGPPKVTDFGLAKLLDADAGQTQTGAVLGTPAYMAPEQAAGGPNAAGPPADIYALGVILYECLTGRPPFLSASTAETLHLVRTADPVPPRRLAAVPRDLETVTLRCLEKDPARRYSSADELAADLRRFLDGRPVLARRAGALGRAIKWCRRRPAWAALIGLTVLGIIVGAAGVAGFTARLRTEAERANRGEAEAIRQRERADADYRDARAALQRMLDRVRDGRRDIPAVKDLQRQQAEAALIFYQAVADRADGRAEVRLDAARAAREAAQLQGLLGRHADARANRIRAAEQFAGLADAFPGRPEYRAELARALTDLGSQQTAVEPAAARTSLARAQSLWEALVAADPGSAEYRDGLATCHHTFGNYWHTRPSAADAARHYRAAIDLREQLLREQPANRALRRRLAETLLNLSVELQSDKGRVAEAQTAHDRAEAEFEHVLRETPDESDVISDLAIMRMNWAYMLAGRGRTDQALADLAKNVPALEAVLAREPNDNAARNALTRSVGTRAVLLDGAGRYAEAAAAWERLVALVPPAEQSAYRLSLAQSLARAGKYDRAVEAAEAAVAGLPAKTGYDQFGPPVGVCTAILAGLANDPTLSAAHRRGLTARAGTTARTLLEKAKAALPPEQWRQLRADPALASLRNVRECRPLFAGD
jgi:tetratricopeptide (TPR) repeat protein